MQKAKAVIGKEVLSRADGQKLDSIKDLILATDHSRIVSLLVDEGGLFGTARVIPIDKVLSFGTDVVVVTDNEAVVSADSHPPSKEGLASKDRLVGKKVFTERGDEQARVNDIYFDENGGQVTGFELAGGQVENAPPGSAFLPIEEVISIGHDAVVVKADAVANMLARGGGPKT